MLDLIAQYDALRYVLLLLIFAAVVFGTLWGVNSFYQRSVVRSEVAKIAEGTIANHTGPRGGLRATIVETGWARLARAIEDAGLNLGDTDADRLSKKLKAAGFVSPGAPKVYTLIRLCMIFLLPLAYLGLVYLSAEQPSFLKIYLICAGLALMGLMLPSLYVQARADRRQEEITNGFPDCLDLMLVCVESGLGIEAAMDRVGREMVVSHPRVAELLSLAVLMLRAGASREESFRKMADASGVDDIRSFTTLVIQSDKLGTSIATTLRVYAAEMREKRRMRAEEKAHRLPVLISIPLVACMLPTMIGTLMLPAVVMVAREIFPLLAGR
jgi:tight adherence protein C